MKFFMLGLLFSAMALAGANDLAHRPKSFNAKSGKAVFVDFTEASYVISYDISKKESKAQATIKFYAPEAGHPIFDSVATPSSIILDGKATSASLESTPSRETTLRVVDQEVTKGAHTLLVTVPLSTLVNFKSDGVKSAFWTSDLDERQFMERYLPANFEFDQVKMSFVVNFIGNKTPQKIYTNGIVSKIGANSFQIEYPDYFTSSSIFFHTVPQEATDELRFSLKSIDGRDIPAVVYLSSSYFGSNSSQLERLKNKASEVFHELESDYGAWAHPVLIVYNAGSGGMEYCGATMTDYSALGHEMFHSYFARGVMPANGNTGWLDEALASWRDEGYPSISTLSGSSRMSSHPYYTRTTDDNAYTFGQRFMSYLDNRFHSHGGLKPFMRHMVEYRRFAPLFVEEFIQEMSQFYGEEVSGDFNRYTYGKSRSSDSNKKTGSNPHHQKMSLAELQNHL